MEPRSDINRSIFYKVADSHVDSMLKQASDLFNKYTSCANKQSLLDAIQIMKSVITSCETRHQQSNDNASYAYDLAFCYRRYASIIIRDESDENKFLTARELLEKSLQLHASFSSKDPTIQLELQRTLHQMRKVAYELKDGLLLQQVIDQLLPLAKSNALSNYLEDCNESLFHLAFAKKNFALALSYVPKDQASGHEIKTHLIILQEYAGDKASTVPTIKAYFKENIEEKFWEVYDKNKEELKAASSKDLKKANERMMKSLILLFNIRCQRHALGMTWGKRPIEYVLGEAKAIFGDIHNFYYKKLRLTLQTKAAQIKAENFLPLDYAYFEGSNVPGIHFSPEIVSKMFIDRAPQQGRYFTPSTSSLSTDQATPAQPKVKNQTSMKR